MRQHRQSFRYGLIGMCFIGVVMVIAGCSEIFTTTSASETANTATLLAEADDGVAAGVSCFHWEALFVPVEDAEAGTFVTKWHSPSSVIAVDGEGNVYVQGYETISTVNNVEFFGGIKKYDPNGALLAKWSTEGGGDGKFRAANDMVIDGQGNIFIADQDAHGIQKLDANGMFVTRWGSHGLGDGQFWGSPSRLAVDAEGNVYATNSNHLQIFDNDGKFLRKWKFIYNPYGVAVDAEGNVYTTDPRGYKIRKYDATGKPLAKWGGSGGGDSSFGYYSALDLSVDIFGNVYVFDDRNYRIQKFNNDGSFVAKWGSVGKGDGQFGRGYSQGEDYGMLGGVAADLLGVVYVLDGNNHRVQKFCGGL